MKYKLKSEENVDIIELICRNRGVDFRSLENFLNPTERAIQTPTIYTNLQKACETIIEAVASNKKLGIVVDSDVDGYCSSAMLISYLNTGLGFNNMIWLLHENKQHGLKEGMLERIIEADVDVVILPDASSSDYKEHNILKELGKTIIVIDHHEAERYSEDAIVVNNQLDNFGNKTLCGGGMIMKVLEYLDDITGLQIAHGYMDLCATALVGDCMLMTHPETRYYVQAGLKQINNPLLFEIYKAESSRNFELVSFDIAPTINAFIRVATQEEKLDLFNAMIGFEYEKEVSVRGKGTFNLKLPEYIATLSNRIKSRQSAEIKKAIEEKCEMLGEDLPFSICILDLDVNKNLTGLIGSRLVDKYNKPMIVIKNYGGIYRGSARTTDTFQEFKTYLQNLGYFEFCEGHQQAFGLAITELNFNKMIKEMSGVKIGEDSDINLVDKAYIGNVSAYEIMAVDEFKNHWCRGFEKPTFYIKLEGLDSKDIRIVGQNRDTIQIRHNYITYVKFKCSEEEIKDVENTNITGLEIIGTFAVNEWNNRLYPQVMIDKLELVGTQEVREVKPVFGFGGFGNVKW